MAIKVQAINFKTAKKGDMNCVYELEGHNDYTCKKLKEVYKRPLNRSSISIYRWVSGLI